MPKKRTAQSLAAEQRFLAILAAEGATPLESEWRSIHEPYRIQCREGHKVDPRPDNVLQGHAICRTCANRDSAATETRFRAVLAEMGAELLDPWTDSHKKHRVRCADGHVTERLPTNILRGHTRCSACIGHDPVNAAVKFREGLARWGATLIEGEWLGAKARHRAICAQGHPCKPAPGDVLDGHNPCLRCVGQDPVVNMARFCALLEDAGATLLEPEWLGTHAPHDIRCAEGHLVSPRPGDVFKGTGVCRTCAGRIWDVFYVVINPSKNRIKFGISSGDPEPRLRVHRRYGYTVVERLLTNLPASVPLGIERAVRPALRLAGFKAVHGREYYDSAALAVVLDIVDNFPITIAA